MRNYSPRGMPARFMEGAPKIVRDSIIDIIAITPACPLDYDIIFRDVNQSGYKSEMVGLDFCKHGRQGCHFFLTINEMRRYRERNRRKRVSWNELPEATKSRILNYLNEPA